MIVTLLIKTKLILSNFFTKEFTYEYQDREDT